MHYTPTYKARDTARNIGGFIKSHGNELWNLVKTVGPWLVGLLLLSVALQDLALRDIMDPRRAPEITVNDIYYGSPYTWAGYGIQLLIGYLFAVIAVSWHRLVLLGPQHYRPMKIFSPQKHEVEFILVLALVSAVIPGLASFALVQFVQETSLDSTSSFGGAVLASILFSILFVYFFYKISFFFPAKAVNASIDFQTSFRLTAGYFWKFIFSCILASLKIVFFLLLYMIGASLVFAPVAAHFGDSSSLRLWSGFYQLLFGLPILLYFQPVLTIIGVTALSNYYQYALQHKNP